MSRPLLASLGVIIAQNSALPLGRRGGGGGGKKKKRGGGGGGGGGGKTIRNWVGTDVSVK